MEVDVLLLTVATLIQFINITWSSISARQEYELWTLPLFYDENHYFEIVEPEQISYFYRIRQARDFGSSLNRTLLNIELVPTEPRDGCGSLNNLNYVQNNIAFVERGGCSFLGKAINAERAGAVAVIIYDNDSDNDDKMVDMIQDETTRKTDLPAYFLMGKDGHIIVDTLQHQSLRSAVINIPINVTGIPVATLHGHRPPWTLW